MKLERLPVHALFAAIHLTEDQVFQKRFKEDEQLSYLQSLEHNKQIEKYELILALDNKIEIYGKELNPLTLALFSYLYSIKSNIVFDVHNITTIDLDLFFYLLQTKDYSLDLKKVLKNSMGYCQKVMGMTLHQTIELFSKIYKVEFRCLNLFNKICQQREALFNIDWMISIVSKVKPLTSYSTKELYKEISISQIYYYFANFCRMQGDQSIFFKAEDEILFEEDRRMCELIIDRLIEKGVIDQKERDDMIKLIVQENK